MKAFVITEPGSTSYREVSAPPHRDSDVLLRVQRVGFCGSDLSTFRGLNPLVSYPRIPGHEIAAEVVAIGSSITDPIALGEQVTVLPYTECGHCSACMMGRFNACRLNQTLGVQRDGAMTELLAVPCGKVVRAPGLQPAELALIEPLAVGFHAVQRARVTASDTVCVLGSGMVGLGVIAAASLRCRARVIAVDVDDRKLELAIKAGAGEVINSTQEDPAARLRELTGGEGAGVLIEAVGLPVTFQFAVSEVAYGGRVVYIGYAKERVAFETKWFLLKELDIMGSRGSTRSDFENVIEVLAESQFPVAETISSVIPFAEAGEALAAWAKSPARITKIHVDLTS